MIKYFLTYVIKKNLLSNIKLLEIRQLSKKCREIIDNSSDIKRIITYQHEIQKKLSYDKNIYDQFHYKRILIQKSLSSIYSNYKKLRIPIIIFGYLGLDFEEEIEKTYYISEEVFPLEFRIFLYEYYCNPTVYVKLYPPNIIQKSLDLQKSGLRNYICQAKGKPDIYNVVYLIPLCY